MPAKDVNTLTNQAGPIIRALAAVREQSRRPLSMATQEGRFRIQKTVYLLRHLGYPPAQKYQFNLYHMGPYSPNLADAYYAVGEEGLRQASRTPARDIPPNHLSVVCEALSRPDHFLEGLTTVLDVWRVCHDLKMALPQAQSIKPRLESATWKEVRRFLTDHPALTQLT